MNAFYGDDASSVVRCVTDSCGDDASSVVNKTICQI